MSKQNIEEHRERQRQNYKLCKIVDAVWKCSYCKKRKHASQFNKKYLCKSCHSKQVRTHAAKHAERYRMLQKLRVYKITEQQYLALSKTCECCGSSTKLGIDHNHNTGVVRGILCTTCNTALACLKDDPNLIMELFMYLQEGAKCEESKAST
jgi:hypothetical protein